MARGRAPGYDDQREMILKRAAHLFARRGYSATSMNEVAEACSLSKATLYHYYRDKYSLLVSIAESHVSHLQILVAKVQAMPHLSQQPDQQLRRLITHIVHAYAHAQDAHRVLTEDVKFLQPQDRDRVLDKEREVVSGFAKAIGQIRPDLKSAALTTPLTMLLMGMINWMFTWMRPEGTLDYAAIAPIVEDLFLGGLAAVKIPVHFSPITEFTGVY